jgi:HlyD family secretion protein
MNAMTKKILVIVVLIVLAGAAIGAVVVSGDGSGSSSANQSFFTVESGPLKIHLTETGTVKSRDQFIVKNEVEGRTSIIYVIDEGAVVKKGELLVELDSSALEDRLVDQQIQVENTEADFVSAKENLEVVKIQTQSNIAAAEQDNQFAIEDKTKYLEGEWPKTLMQAETDLTLAEEDLRRATDEFDWSKKLYAEKYLSETEYRADELALKRAELQVALSSESLKLLKEYTHTRRLDELDSEIHQKELALQKVNRESSSNLVQAQARLRAREAELNRQKDRLAKIQDQIKKTKIYAPADGMVVYATSSEFSWRGDTEPLDEGQEVRERQELIHLPTADSMMVEIRVQESALGKVEIGQEVAISIDALPEQRFTGRVTKIAPLPDAQSVFMNPDLKVYDTQIMIDGVHPQLRTGMSCQATILIADYDDALAVPLQAVVGRGSESVVYVLDGDSGKARTVKTGLDNNALVHIIDGLSEGDRVMLTPPLSGDTTNRRVAQDESTSEEGSDAGADDSSDSAAQPTRRERPSGARQGQRPENAP